MCFLIFMTFLFFYYSQNCFHQKNNTIIVLQHTSCLYNLRISHHKILLYYISYSWKKIRTVSKVNLPNMNMAI